MPQHIQRRRCRNDESASDVEENHHALFGEMLYQSARKRLQQDGRHIVKAEDERHHRRAVRNLIHQPGDGDTVDGVPKSIDHVCRNQLQVFFLCFKRAVGGYFVFHTTKPFMNIKQRIP